MLGLIFALAASIGPVCTYNGHTLYGRVQFVDRFPDIKIKVVQHFPDLNVQRVRRFPDKCGKWQIGNRGLKVKIVTQGEDITVRWVARFPGA